MKHLTALATALLALPLAASAATPPSATHHAMAKSSVQKMKAKPASSSIVSITLPTNVAYDYKQGPGLQVAQTYCLTCHSAGYVKMQPSMDAAHWMKTVTKMRKLYGAQISDADATKIADYLGSAYGPNGSP